MGRLGGDVLDAGRQQQHAARYRAPAGAAHREAVASRFHRIDFVGVPIGQILIPGREDDEFLKVTSMAFLPGSNEMVILALNELKKTQTVVFRAKGFAPGPSSTSPPSTLARDIGGRP